MEKKKLNVAGAAAFDNILSSMARVEPKQTEPEQAPELTNDAANQDQQVNAVEQKGRAAVAITPEPSNPVAKENKEVEPSENFSKKELEVIKRFLAERKNKGKSAPVMVELPLKDILEQISRYMGITMSAFACNIIEDNIRENKKTYLELMNRKKPSISL